MLLDVYYHLEELGEDLVDLEVQVDHLFDLEEQGEDLVDLEEQEDQIGLVVVQEDLHQRDLIVVVVG